MSIQLLTIKEIAEELNCSYSTAKRHAKDVKEHYNLQRKIPKMLLYEYFLDKPMV